MFLKNSIFTQMRLMCNKNGFKVALSINMAFALITYLYYVWTYWEQDVSTIVSPSAAFLLLESNPFFAIYIELAPFVVVLPFAMSFVTDKQNLCLPLLQSRCGVKTYYYSKAITSFIGGVLVFLIPGIINIILNNITFPQSGITFIGDMYDKNYVGSISGSNALIETDWAGMWFPKIFVKNPEVYNIIVLIMFSLLMGLFSVLVYSLSFYITKHKIMLFLPLYGTIVVLNIMDSLLKYWGVYICTKVLLYVSGDTSVGKCPIFLIGIVVVIIIVSSILITTQVYKDQIE